MATEKILMKLYSGFDVEKDSSKENFLISDLFGLLKFMGLEKTKILFIQNYNGTQEEKADLLKEVTSSFVEENFVIITWAYLSTKEFPPTEFYDPDNSNKVYIKNRLKHVPYDEIIKRESELLESVGFKNFNKLTGYEYSEFYLYQNEIGKKLIDYIEQGEI